MKHESDAPLMVSRYTRGSLFLLYKGLKHIFFFFFFFWIPLQINPVPLAPNLKIRLHIFSSFLISKCLFLPSTEPDPMLDSSRHRLLFIHNLFPSCYKRYSSLFSCACRSVFYFSWLFILMLDYLYLITCFFFFFFFF